MNEEKASDAEASRLFGRRRLSDHSTSKYRKSYLSTDEEDLMTHKKVSLPVPSTE